MDNSNLPYRPCVGVMIMNNENKIFVARRIDTTSEAWQMPQGGIDEGEEPIDTLLREVKEEIGTNNIEVIKESRDWLSYDLPDELIPRLWGGKYKGQTQKWFLAKFKGNDSEINLETDHPEFSEWKWIEANNLPDLIVPFKKQLYRDILEEFKDVLKTN